MGAKPDPVSRREFVRGATTLGVAAGAVTAAMWTAPQLSSVALAASDGGGSPMPPTTPPTVSPTTVVPPSGTPVDPNGRRAGNRGRGAGAGGTGSGAGGTLPFTGANSEELAKLGAASTAGGAALLGLSKLRHPSGPDGDPPGSGSPSATPADSPAPPDGEAPD